MATMSPLRRRMIEDMTSATGRPAYHPSVLLKLYIYGCQSGSVEPAA